MISPLKIIGEKDVRTPPLSIAENRTSLAVAVLELLSLHPPLFISGAENKSPSIRLVVQPIIPEI